MSRPSLSLFPIPLLLLASGCATYQPAPLMPREELSRLSALRVPEVVVVHEESAAPEPERRIELSDGLSEAEAVAVALSLNPELAARRASIGETRALLIGAGLFPNPEVGVGFRQGISGTPGFTVDAELLFELLRLGERRGQKAVASARIDEARASLLVEEYELATRVRAQVLSVLAQEHVASLLEEELSIRERASALVVRQRDVGEANELDVSAASLEAADLRRELRQTRAELGTTRLELNRLMGLPPTVSVTLTESGQPLRVAVLDDLSDEALTERLLAGRLELRAKEAEYERTERELKLAVLRQYPRLRLGPGFSHEGEDENYLGVGASIELPLFDRNQGEIAERSAERDRVRAEYTGLLHRLNSEAHAARARVRLLHADVDAQEREVLPLLRRHQEVSQGAFEAREMGVLDWLTTQQRVLRTRRAFVESLVDYRRALLQLDASLGLSLTRALPPSSGEPAGEKRNNQ